LATVDPTKWEVPARTDFNLNAPRWSKGTYPEAAADIATDMIAVAFYELIDKKQGDPYDLTDSYVRVTLISEAIQVATKVLEDMEGDIERAKYILIYTAQKTGAWRTGLIEYASLEDWLQQKLDSMAQGSAGQYRIRFLLGELFPLLEKLSLQDPAIHPTNILKMQKEWSKTVASIPYMRKLYDEYMASMKVNEKEIEKKGKVIGRLQLKKESLEEEAPERKVIEQQIIDIHQEVEGLIQEQETKAEEGRSVFTSGVSKVIEVISDPEVQAWRGDRNVTSELTNYHKPQPTIYTGWAGIVNDQAIIVVSIPAYLKRSTETALKAVATLVDTDPAHLADDVRRMYEDALGKEE
jgi:hypothetical protein